MTMGANASMRMFVESSPDHKAPESSQDRKAPECSPDHKHPLAAIPPELWCYSISEKQCLVGGDLADGGSIYAWGMEQLAGASPFPSC